MMAWLRLLSIVLCVVMLTRCDAASAGPRGQGGGGGGGGGERSKLVPRSYHRLPARARHASDAEDFMIDDEELIDVPKRTYSDYGHMRFGKRDDKFDDYGHMRFGRADY